MNTFQDLEHALLSGVVLGTLRKSGITADVLLNEVEDTTPYLHLTIEGGVEAVIVVLPRE
jgi:hypothetical protein